MKNTTKVGVIALGLSAIALTVIISLDQPTQQPIAIDPPQIMFAIDPPQ